MPRGVPAGVRLTVPRALVVVALAEGGVLHVAELKRRTGLSEGTLLGARGLLARLREEGWLRDWHTREAGQRGADLHLHELTSVGARMVGAARVVLSGER